MLCMKPGEVPWRRSLGRPHAQRRRDARLSSSDELTELLETGAVATMDAPKRTGIWIWPWISC